MWRKQEDPDRVHAVGQALRAQCRAVGIPFIANDSISLAQVLDADGVHLGQDDGNVTQARRMLGPDALIGLSVSKPEHWQAYEAMAVDYVGLGPFAITTTKPDARQPLGADGTQALRQGWDRVPAVSIGGISLDQAPAALRTGVQGIAVVSAIAGAPDPKTAAQKLAALIQS